jgi:murein L,D-transpeptidase YafK
MKTLFIGAAILAAGMLAVGAWRWHLRTRQVPVMARPEAQADLIEVFKADRRMDLKRAGQLLKSYTVALGSRPIGHKEVEGDGRTPEGNYVIDARNPKSAFHLSLRVSYPDACDQARAATEGVSPGGDIFIHGQPNSGASTGMQADWTQGCIAVSNAEIREIWSLVPTGARIVIHP